MVQFIAVLAFESSHFKCAHDDRTNNIKHDNKDKMKAITIFNVYRFAKHRKGTMMRCYLDAFENAIYCTHFGKLDY